MERTSSKEEILWNRFTKVRRAIHSALTEQTTTEFNREFNTFSWSGYDAGIHDHKGHLQGNIRGIELDINIKGATVEDNPKYETGSEDNWILTHNTEHHLFLSGKFTSADGRDGLIDIEIRNGHTHYEAYWLTYLETKYQLEQIINPEGKVFDATKLLSNRKGEIAIPGTKITLKSLLKKHL